MNEKIVNEYYKSSINLGFHPTHLYASHCFVQRKCIENIFLTNIFFLRNCIKECNGTPYFLGRLESRFDEKKWGHVGKADPNPIIK